MTDTGTKSNRSKVRTRGAAEYSGLAESTLEKLRVSGGGPRYIRVGRVVVYDLDDLDAWLDAHNRVIGAGLGGAGILAGLANSGPATFRPHHYSFAASWHELDARPPTGDREWRG